MLLKIALDGDHSGHLSELVSDAEVKSFTVATVLTGIRGLVVRNKPNKVLNDYSIVHDPKCDDMGKRTFRVMARHGSVELAKLEICLDEHTYKSKMNPIERKRGLTAELEVSVQRTKRK